MPQRATPEELASFGTLPDDALVSQPMVEGLLQASSTTVWRLTGAGRLPQPVKITARSVRWRVGELRLALARFSAP